MIPSGRDQLKGLVELQLRHTEAVRDRLMRWLKEAHERCRFYEEAWFGYVTELCEATLGRKSAEAERDAARRCYDVAEESNREYVAANTELKNALDAAVAKMEAAQKDRLELWRHLDNIDSADDFARSDDAKYRRIVHSWVKRRFHISSSDGYTVVFNSDTALDKARKEAI